MPAPNVPVNPDVENFTRAMRGLSSLASGAGSVLAGVLQFGAIGDAALVAAAGIPSFVGSPSPLWRPTAGQRASAWGSS
ncbi:hypothetical protein GCM10010207_82030 [Streptomyces atratus]|nr:hypothetical protein GCM10010207_82030 [Streptomyces atratus]